MGISAAMFWWSLAISTAIAAAQYQAGQNNAKAQSDYQKQVQDQTAESAKQSQIDQTKQLNLGLIQEQASTSKEASSIQKEKVKAIGTATTAAGEKGVSGISLDNLNADFNRQESVYIDSLKYNLDMSEQQLAANSQGITSQTASRINNSRAAPVSRPDIYSAALGIASKTIDYGTKYKGWGRNIGNT